MKEQENRSVTSAIKSDEIWGVVKSALSGTCLSVVMPVFNLASSIRENLVKTAELYSQNGIDVELIVVDDGSTDSTWAEIMASTGEVPANVKLKPVRLSQNAGKGSALKAGFASSTGRYVLLLDGDLDINPKQTPYFFSSLVENNADIVVGSKRHKNSIVQYPWHRRILSKVYFSLVYVFIGLPITDTQTGMKLFKREVLAQALERMLVKTYAFDLELLAIAHERGAKIAEAPVVIKFGNKFGALRVSTVRNMAIDTLAVFYRLKLLKYYASVNPPRPADRTLTVSVVIACPETSWMLNECLSQLEKQSYKPLEIIVLPDSETGKVRPAEKRNIGIKRAKGDVVAFIDDDAYPDVHWIENAIKYFSEDSIAAVGGPGVTPPNDSYLAKVGGKVYKNPLVSGNYRYRYATGGICRDVDDFPSCNLFVRRSVLESFGGYRTDFWPGEDTLLCKDIIDGGGRIVYDPWVLVYHHRRPLFMPHIRQISRYAFHRGYFCRKFPSNSLRFSYFVPTLFFLYVVSALAAISFLPSCSDGVCKTFLLFYACVPSFMYFILVILTSISLNPITMLLAAIGVCLTHLVYGVQFARGLVARCAPCEFIGQDHAKK